MLEVLLRFVQPDFRQNVGDRRAKTRNGMNDVLQDFRLEVHERWSFVRLVELTERLQALHKPRELFRYYLVTAAVRTGVFQWTK